MTLTIELSDHLEAALKQQANAKGVSQAGNVRTLLKRDLSASTATRLCRRSKQDTGF